MSSNSCCKKTEAPLAQPGRLLVLLCCLLACSLCHAAGWRDELPQAKVLGDGDMHWFGFRIYHATLWSEQLPFDSTRPFALQLSYYRSISRARLVQTSLDEIERLSPTRIDPVTLARWETALSSAFTDVAPGDQLIGVYQPQRGIRFYNQQRQLAVIDDVILAHAFFGIWLDQATRDQRLRRQLLGDRP